MSFDANAGLTSAIAGVFVPLARLTARGRALAFQRGELGFASALTVVAVQVFVIVATFG